ncbi:unnamed protein product, partial [Linum tenue]
FYLFFQQKQQHYTTTGKQQERVPVIADSPTVRYCDSRVPRARLSSISVKGSGKNKIPCEVTSINLQSGFYFWMMRRQGQYADSGGTAYGGGQMQQSIFLVRGVNKGLIISKDNWRPSSKPDGQWRWVRDESKAASSVASQMFNEGQVVDASRPYIQGKRSESHVGLEQQGNVDMQSSLLKRSHICKHLKALNRNSLTTS